MANPSASSFSEDKLAKADDGDLKSDLNAVIMDYLISEGYPDAAQKFAIEANIKPMMDVEEVEDRVAIREALYKGDIQTAIERINELNPEVRSPIDFYFDMTTAILLCCDYVLFMHHS